MAEVTITSTVKDGPLGQPTGQYRFSLPGYPSIMVPYGTTPLRATFHGVANGTYVATVELLDAGGAIVGATQTPPFTVTPADIVLQVPATATVEIIRV